MADTRVAVSQPLKLLLESPVLIAVILISGIGGTFQYGFQISVMTSPSLFIKDLVNVTCARRYSLFLEQWQLSLIWSFIVSIFCIGGLIGSLSAGQLTLYGRKQCLLFNNFVAITGAVLMLLSKTAMSFEMIMVGRFLYGINAGVSLVTHIMYLVDCAPKRLRGMVGVSVATFISMGKFSGQLLGIRELLGTEERWPWLLGFSGFTALLQLLTLPLLPESPRFLLLERGDRHGCEKAIRRLWGNKDWSVEVEDMLEEGEAVRGVPSHTVMGLIRYPTVRWQLLTILVTFTTVQLCGINAVYMYSHDVFRAAGIHSYQLPYAALGTGLCELFTSIACFMVIESTGKKVLLFRGYFGMAASLGLLTITLYLQHKITWMPYCSMVLIFIFILFFSSGPGGITASFPAELFTQSFKSAGYTIACIVNWTCLFLMGMLFPLIVEHLDYLCFLIFLCFCLFTGLYVHFNVPETRNRTVLEITAEFQKMHSKTERLGKRKSNELRSNEIPTQTKL
ncbi:solute carrier family 2 member 11, like [Diretmus argenteus]